MRPWLRATIRPPGGHPAPATYVMDRLAAAVAALLRVSVAVVGGAAAIVGLAPPARPAWVYPAVGLSLLWSLAYARLALRSGLRTWSTLADVALTTGLCVVQVPLTARDALPAGAGWLEILGTVTIVACHFTWRVPAAVAGGLVVVAGYLAGASRAELPDHGIGEAAVFAIQIGSAALLMVLIRRAAAAADTALADRAREQARARSAGARRRVEREHNRQLHDTALATLTMVGTGVIASGSTALRERSLADLELIESLDRPLVPGQRRPAEPGTERLDERLGAVVAAVAGLRVALHVTACRVPAPVAAAFADATAEALANVVRHAGTGAVEVRLATSGGRVRVEVADAGTGFEPALVPPARYGIREAIVGRMRAAGGGAEVTSAPGRGTRVVLEWSGG